MSDVSKLAQAIIAALTPFVTDAPVVKDDAPVVKDDAPVVKDDTPVKDNVVTWALCAAKDFFIPHNHEIHAQTKRINADGTWMKYKGLKPETFTQLEGAWIDKHGKDASAYNCVDGQLEKVVVETTPSKPGPSKPGPSKPGPSKPGPSKPGPSNDRKAAMQAIDLLYKSHQVQYEDVVEQLFDGADSFEGLTDEQCTVVLREAKAWADWLNMIKEVVAQTAEIDTRGDEIVSSATNYYINEVSSNGELSGVPRDALGSLHAQLQDVFNEWNSYYEG